MKSLVEEWIKEKKEMEKSETQYLNSVLPKPIVKALKKYAPDHKLMMRAVVHEAMEEYLRGKGALIGESPIEERDK